jgi:hypothetical protein
MRILRRGTIVSLCGVSVLALVSTLPAQDAPDNSCEAVTVNPGRIYRVGKDDVTAPRLIHAVDPEYSEKARCANSRERSCSPWS